jgi:hypothetical protein
MTAKVLLAFFLGVLETASVCGIIYSNTDSTCFAISVLGAIAGSFVLIVISINWLIDNSNK